MSMGQVSKMVGARVKRTEDPRMITGTGSYTDDIQLKGSRYMEVLRSPYGHARITRIDISKAVSSPGVVEVLTAKDINSWCKIPFPLFAILDQMHQVDRWPMATDIVRFVGEPVAVVAANSAAAAKDALDLIEVDYEQLPAAVDLESAANPDAPLVHENIGTNLCYEATGSSGDPEKAFAEADAVMSVRLEQPRLIPNPIEPRGVVASYHSGSKELTLWVTTQNPHTESSIVAQMLGIRENKLRVIAVDVGGAFGCKINTYPESIIAAVLSMRLVQPVKWAESRQENFISTSHGRGQVQYVEAAYNKDGAILGLKLRIYADLGAYCQVLSHAIPNLTPSMAPGVYSFKNIAWTTYGVFTNKVPYDAYRGAGRPEGAYIIERAVDLIANALGMDPTEIRRRNFIPKESFPYQTPTGMVYDSGDYEASLDKAISVSDYHGLRREQEEARRQGRIMGIGITTTVEVCGFGPAAAMGGLSGFESATVRVDSTGGVTVLTGSSPHGQGGETSFAQLAADELGVPLDTITVVHGDTAIVPRGGGTSGSRSMAVGGSAVVSATAVVMRKAKEIAAALLNTGPEHVLLENGQFSAEDIQDKSITWADVATEAYAGQNLPSNVERGLEATSFWEPEGLTFPFSTHVAVVEIDSDTGEVRLTKYAAVDDCGVVINPMLVEGQIHGGIAQGAGQALLEASVWDEHGQLVTGSFMDYAMPFADEFPEFILDRTVTPTHINPMGVKGIAEMATVASTPTIVNAVADALSFLGSVNIDMPIHSEKVWRLLQGHAPQ